MRNPPTDPRHPDRPVSVTLKVNIVNIDKIDTVNMMFALTMEVNFEWRDHRLKYRNLRPGMGQNHLTEAVKDDYSRHPLICPPRASHFFAYYPRDFYVGLSYVDLLTDAYCNKHNNRCNCFVL